MRFRTLAGVAAGALTAGMFAVPAVAVAAAPSASATAAAEFDCKYNTYNLAYSGDIEATLEGGSVKLNMPAFPGISGVPAFVTVSKVAAEATGTISGSSATFTGTENVSPATPLSGGFSVPQLSAAAPAEFEGGPVVISGLEVSLTAMGTESEIPCTMAAPVTITLEGGTVEPTDPSEGAVAFDCTGPFGPMTYETTGLPTVVRAGDSVSIDWAMKALPGIVPVAASANITVAAKLLVNGAEVDASGTHTVAFAASEPIALPNVKASVKTPATTIDVKVSSVEIKVTNYNMTFPCTLAEPADLGSHTVDAEPKPETPAPAAKVKANLKNVKANYAKKKKVLTVKAAVKGSKGTATGQVKIQIKKGKKTVRTVTVKLNKKGAFNKKIKKIKGKGKFKVVIQYQGDKNYKTAKATKQFRA